MYVFLIVLVIVLWLVHNEVVTDRVQMFTEAYPYVIRPSKLGGTWSDSDSSNADSRFDDFVGLEQSVEHFQNFFGQMDTECDVDHVGTDMNIVRFPDQPILDRIDRQRNPLMIFNIFSAKWAQNSMLTTCKQF